MVKMLVCEFIFFKIKKAAGLFSDSFGCGGVCKLIYSFLNFYYLSFERFTSSEIAQ